VLVFCCDSGAGEAILACEMRQVKPVKPALLDPLAAELLEQLALRPAARSIVLGAILRSSTTMITASATT